MGYFSYEYLGYSEPAVRCEVEDAEKFKDVDVMLFDKVIAFDHVKQKLILIVNMPLSDVEVGYNKADGRAFTSRTEKRGAVWKNDWGVCEGDEGCDPVKIEVFRIVYASEVV